MNTTNPFSIINKYREEAPVNVVGLVRELGLKICEIDSGKLISGAIEKSANGTYTIIVNAADSFTRKRFTIAHELGHYILHRDKIGDGITDDRMYRAGITNDRIGSKEETQANQFAANLLMPKELIEKLRSEKIGTTGFDLAIELAKKLDVSPQAMAIRLKSLDC